MRLDKETPQQKALRAELAAMKGSKVVFNANWRNVAK